MNQTMKRAVSNLVVLILGIVVASGIIILKPWQDSVLKETILSVGIQEQRDGVGEAIANNYPMLTPVQKRDGEYELSLYNIMVEEGRLHYEAKLIFPKTREVEPVELQILEDELNEGAADTAKGEIPEEGTPEGQTSNEKAAPAEQKQTMEEQQGERMKGAVFRLFLIDTENEERSNEIPLSYESIPQMKEEELVYKVNGILTSVDIKYVIQGKKKLVTEVSYFDTQKKRENDIASHLEEKKVELNYPLYTFGPSLLPFDESKVLNTIHIPINQEIPTEYGSVIVDELIVGPSQIALATRDALEKGYDLAGFEGGRLVDKQGNIYTLQRSYAFSDSPEGKMRFYFNPTDFFEVKDKREYSFQFSDIALNDGRKDKIDFKLHGQFPYTFEVTGKKVSIVERSYDDKKQVLTLKIEYNPEEIQLQADLSGSHSNIFAPATIAEETQFNKQTQQSFVTSRTIVPGELKCRVPRQEDYTLVIKHNDFLVHKSGELWISEN